MVAIPALTEVTTAAVGDDIVIETAAGTRRISRVNFQLRRTELTLLTPPNINVDSDTIWISDATDGILKGITAFNILFANYTNTQVADTFALDPALHNARPIELIDPFTTANITLDSSTPGIGGASFNLFNFTLKDITVTALNAMVIFKNAVSSSPVTIRRDTAATIQVADNGNEAIFAGG